MAIESYGSGSGSGYGYGDGYGYGYGDGDGDGYGDGYGYGYGYGYGDGDGSGDGSGYGYGYGSGSGYGYGSGDGDGDGDGSGSGYGYGDGDGDGSGSGYLDAIVAQYARDGRKAAIWRSKQDGTPANGGTGPAAYVGMISRVVGPLKLCGANALHGTLKPDKWKGDRWWVVSLKEPVICEDDKMGSLEREIMADLGKCPF